MHDTIAFAPLYLPSNALQSQIGALFPAVTVVAGVAATASTVFPGGTENNLVQIRVANKTTVWVHINFGVLLGGQTVRAATLNDVAVGPGAVEVFTVDPEVNAASVISDGAPVGATSVMFTRGAGL